MAGKAKILFLQSRPWSFSMTAISVILGALTVLLQPSFNWFYFILVLIGMVLVHAATNVINDYFDVKNGVDKPDSPTAQYRPHFLLDGTLTLKQALRFALILYAVAAAIGIYLTVMRGWIILVFAGTGGLFSFFYAGGPVRYKYKALGELAVFLMWGPLMLIASMYAASGTWDALSRVLLLSVPQGLWVTLVILANNLKDVDYDSRVGVSTAGTVLGRKYAFWLYLSLVVIIFAVTILEIPLKAIPIWGLSTFAVVPLTVKLLLELGRSEKVPPDADPKTARIGMFYGILLILSIVIDEILLII
ncbi:MAG: prenyltransferase [Spirochaetales bacterium]|nr:MAG: prenyltransferase [Spirochaetales bacterium]